MDTKFVELVNRNANDELQAYFANMPPDKPLDWHDEKVLLEHFSVPAVKSYINRFRFSEKAEILFVEKAPEDICLSYINYYGLRRTTQKYVIDNGLFVVARDFLRMRSFEDVDYLLDKADAKIIQLHIMQYSLKSDAQVLKLLHHENKSLFCSYVSRGRFISDEVIEETVKGHCFAAFKAIVSRNYRHFKKQAKRLTFQEMTAQKLPDIMLSEKLQVAVLDDYDREFIERMLCTTPLLPKAQEMMFTRNFDPEWLKWHVEHLYGVAGYRFESQFEELLFKKLASRSLDDCLLKFRQQDDVSFVRFASSAAVKKYIKDYWLSDEAQVALILRGDADLIAVFIQRFTPEHGMCWQAEVEMVKICSPDTIKPYIAFHSMCFEALDIVRNRLPELIDFYYAHHAY